MYVLMCILGFAFLSCNKVNPDTPPEEEEEEIPDIIRKIAEIPQVIDTSICAFSDYYVKQGAFDCGYYFDFVQPLDHFDQSVPYKLPQRIYLHYVSPDAPVILYTTGYEAYGDYVPDLSWRIKANVIEFEYRYFATSIPDGMYPDVKWTYLDSRQASADMHAIYEAFKPLFPNKWIASGVSKGGTTAALYAKFYPDDMDLYLPFCAPFFRSIKDPNVGEWITNGIATPEIREKIVKFTKMVLHRQNEILESVGYDEDNPWFEDVRDYLRLDVLGAVTTKMAYDFSTAWIDDLPDEDTPAKDVYYFIYPENASESAFSAFSASESAGIQPVIGDGNSRWNKNRSMVVRARDRMIRTKSDEGIYSDNPYYPQALKELGYFKYDLTPYAEEVAAGLISEKNADHYNFIGTEAERQAITFSDELMTGFLDDFLPQTKSHMLFMYGQNDFWTGGGISQELADKNSNITRFIINDGIHADYYTYYPSAEMTRIENAILNALGWL